MGKRLPRSSALEPKEKDLERQFLDYLNSGSDKAIFAWKNPTAGYFDPIKKVYRKQASPYAINGAPDILMIYKGRFVGLEVKTESGRQTESQKAFQVKAEKVGGLYFVVRNFHELRQALFRCEGWAFREKMTICPHCSKGL